MKNNKYPTIGLKASYCLPFFSLVELVAILLIIGIPWLSNWINHFVLLSLLTGLLDILEQILATVTALLTIGWLATLVITINYQHDNGFCNYLKFLIQTFDLRDFAKIKPKQNTNSAEQAFNNAIKGWYIDISDNNLVTWLLMPASSRAQVIFDQNLQSIENKVKQDNPDFTFSPAERIGNFYKIEATRY